jgi:hypothetical protein
MDKLAKLRKQIADQSPKAPRELIIEYLKLLAARAKAVSATDLKSRGTYAKNKDRFPQTVGEDIASDISSCLAWQDWISWDDAPDLEDIGSIALQLERAASDQALWRKLLDAIAKL